MIRSALCFVLVSMLVLPAISSIGAASSPYNVSTSFPTPLLLMDGKIMNGSFPYLGSNKTVFTTRICVNNSSELSKAIALANLTDLNNPKQNILYVNNSIEASSSGPKLSHDESRIVFTSLWRWEMSGTVTGGKTLDMLVKNTTSGNETYGYVVLLNLTHAAIDYPSFSSDGTKIVYLSNEGGGQ